MMDETRKKYKAINEVIDNLDTELILKTMKYLNWEWANYEELTEADIRIRARDLLEELVFDHKDCKVLESGGLRAEINRFENGDEYYMVSFILTSFDALLSEQK